MIFPDDFTFEYKNFIEFLQSLGSSKKAEFDKKLIRSKANIIGLTAPNIKEIASLILHENMEKLLYSFPANDYYEIELLKGRCMARDKKTDFYTKLSALKDFAEDMDNWAVCDSTASAIKPKKNDLECLFELSGQLIRHPSEFSIRFGVVILLDYFIVDTYIDRVFHLLQGITYGTYYYVDMAVAWLVSKSLICYKEQSLQFLSECENLNDFTYLKALQKAMESFRIGESDKAEYRKLIRQKREKMKNSALL